MFDLEKAIADWRRSMLAAGIKSSETLDELEGHLRDQIERLIQSQPKESLAFEIAVQRIGDIDAIKKEFAKTGQTRWAMLRKLMAITDKIPLPSLENFAPSAKQTLEIAPEEARRLHHDFVGTEHVLLGLTKFPSGIVFKVLQKLGINSEAVRAEIEKHVPIGPEHDVAATIPYTPRAKRAIQLAADQARALHQPHVNPEHLFLGLLLEDSGVAALVLKNLGVRIENARAEIIREMGVNPDIA